MVEHYSATCGKDTRRNVSAKPVTQPLQNLRCMSFGSQHIVDALKFLPDAEAVFGSKNLKELQNVWIIFAKGDVLG